VLVEAGAITRDDLLLALQEQQRTGKRLGEVLIEAGHISWLALAQAMGTQSGDPAPIAQAPPPPPSVAAVVESHDPMDKLEAVESLLRERQRAFIELVSTTERLRRQVAELEERLSERNTELAQMKRASLGIA
jgi:hypothetical protein